MKSTLFSRPTIHDSRPPALLRLCGLLAIVATLALLNTTPGLSQTPDFRSDLPSASSGDLRFFVDTSEFRGSPGWVRREIYVLIDVQQIWPGQETVGELHLEVTVFDSSDAVVLEQKETQRVFRDEKNDRGDPTAPFKEAIVLDLRPGRYRYQLRLEDPYTTKSGTFEGSFLARTYEHSGLLFSDLQFASDLVRTPEEGPFVRQGWKVVPNMTRHHLAGEPLKVYFELYNFVVNEADVEDSFIMGYSLRDSLDQPVRTFPAKRFLKPGESVVKAEFLQTKGLEHGTYSFQVEAFDGSTRHHVSARRTIFIVADGPPEAPTQGQRDLMTYYSDIRYVANQQTLKAYKSQATVEDRVDFLRTFWESLDPTPGSATNERLLDHVLRMNEANWRFSAGKRRKGIDTDRGRILVQYGPPEDTIYRTSAAGRRPYEVWVYEEDRRYDFVFRDLKGLGVYELVHSTYPGELSNPYWAQVF